MQEADLVINDIYNAVASKGRRYKDFAVLYRVNAQSAAFEKALISYNIPYKIVGGLRFYDRKEIKDLIAYLRLVVHSNDIVSLRRVINLPARGIGNVSMNKIMSGQIDELTSSAKKAYFDFEQLLDDLRGKVASKAPPAEIVRELIESLDFRSFLSDGSERADERIENVEMLVANAESYTSLSEFLDDAALLSSVDHMIDSNSVTLMTVHCAKGLEFPVVYVVGLEEGLFPRLSAQTTEAEIEEERRLAYVAMTRAREELTLTYAVSRLLWGGWQNPQPSRFLSEAKTSEIYQPETSASGWDDDIVLADDWG
jgi:DNA helicase-2/ATP-dependent DNA helicase PcrA